MTQEELNRIIDSDSYFTTRKDTSEAEIRLFLREVNFHCPLCDPIFSLWKTDYYRT